MINCDSVQKTGGSVWPGGVLPCYQDFAFSNIRATAESLLLGAPLTQANILPLSVLPCERRRYKRVVLLLVDALGWNLLQQASSDFYSVSSVVEKGRLSRLTSIFPSSTTPHMMNLHFGKLLIQTGICDWTYYDKVIDSVICPLLGSEARDSFGATKKRGSLEVKLDSILPTNTSYNLLGDSGVNSFNFCPVDYADSSFSSIAFSGSTVVPYTTLEQGFSSLISKLERETKPNYSVFYYPKIDSLSHRFGPLSSETLLEVQHLFQSLNALLSELSALEDTLLFVTADHGQVPLKNRVWIDQEIPDLPNFIRSNKRGELIVPCGSDRALFLHVKEHLREQAKKLCQTHLDEVAQVFSIKELLEHKVFGPTDIVERIFAENIGDLLVLPRKDTGIFWGGEQGLFYEKILGAHGGLSDAEAYIPLLSYSS